MTIINSVKYCIKLVLMIVLIILKSVVINPKYLQSGRILKKQYIQLHATIGNKKVPFPNLYKLQYFSDNHRGDPSILFFGDSVMSSISKKDSNRKNLGQLLHVQLEDSFKLLVIDDAGYNLIIFYHFLKAIEKSGIDFQKVIIPINLRSFSPQWFFNPTYQFDFELSALDFFSKTGKEKPIFVDAENYRSTMEKRIIAYQNMDLDYDISKLNKVSQFEKIKATNPGSDEDMRFSRLRNIFTFHYLNQLHPEHRLLQHLKRIVDYFKGSNSDVLLYATPINHKAGATLVGEPFKKITESNRSIINNAIGEMEASSNIKYLDLSTLLDQEYFHHEFIANEHLNYEGRRRLAAKLKQALF